MHISNNFPQRIGEFCLCFVCFFIFYFLIPFYLLFNLANVVEIMLIWKVQNKTVPQISETLKYLAQQKERFPDHQSFILF